MLARFFIRGSFIMCSSALDTRFFCNVCMHAFLYACVCYWHYECEFLLPSLLFDLYLSSWYCGTRHTFNVFGYARIMHTIGIYEYNLMNPAHFDRNISILWQNIFVSGYFHIFESIVNKSEIFRRSIFCYSNKESVSMNLFDNKNVPYRQSRTKCIQSV